MAVNYIRFRPPIFHVRATGGNVVSVACDLKSWCWDPPADSLAHGAVAGRNPEGVRSLREQVNERLRLVDVSG